MAHIDYYFYGASPFTYLGHKAIREVAERHGATLAYKPVNLMGVWEISGAVPPPQRPPVRQRYRLVELQRIAEMRGLPIKLKPAHWPFDATLCDSCMIAIDEQGDAGDFIFSVLSGVWAEDADMADEAQIAEKITAAGFDAPTILKRAKSEDVAAKRMANTDEATAADAIGVPAFVLNGEVFWGQDRIEFIDHALKTGRKPFSPS